MMHEPLVFSTSRTSYLGDAIAAARRLGARRGRAQDVPRRRALPAHRHRSGGSRRHPRRRHHRTTRRRSSSTTSRAASSPAARTGCASSSRTSATRRWSARCAPGEVVTAKTRARLLSSIPMASRGTQVFLLDLHVAAIAHYFEGGIRTGPRLRQAARHRGGAPARRRRLRARLHRRRPRQVGRVARQRSRRRRRVRLQAPRSTARRPRSPASRRRSPASAS